MLKIFLFFIIIFISFYSFYYCPNDLEITHHKRIYNEGKNSIKIAHITDLHTTGLGIIENKLIISLKNEKPDLIVITGDISTPNGTLIGYEEVLSLIQAPLGVYFVNGNWEYWSPIKDLEKIFIKYNIRYLINEIVKLKSGLNLIGFDDIEGNPEIKIIENIQKASLNIALFHSPAYFKSIPNSIHLSLAGHSHGGQVKIPLIGALWTPNGTDEYSEGWFKNEESELYVSRGIGNSVLPIRFNCRPELAIFEIKY